MYYSSVQLRWSILAYSHCNIAGVGHYTFNQRMVILYVRANSLETHSHTQVVDGCRSNLHIVFGSVGIKL